MASGHDLIELARRHVGEKYVLYGCLDDQADPATADAYTRAWERDAKTKGEMVAVGLAASIEGAIVLRYPPISGAMGQLGITLPSAA